MTHEQDVAEEPILSLWGVWVSGSMAAKIHESRKLNPHPQRSLERLAWERGYEAWERETGAAGR